MTCVLRYPLEGSDVCNEGGESACSSERIETCIYSIKTNQDYVFLLLDFGVGSS